MWIAQRALKVRHQPKYRRLFTFFQFAALPPERVKEEELQRLPAMSFLRKRAADAAERKLFAGPLPSFRSAAVPDGR
jgi:hypothetical protein